MAESAKAAEVAKTEVEAPAGTTPADAKPRTRVGEALRCTGIITEWRGYMGWVQPLSKIKHEQASKHKGLIYLNKLDIVQADDNYLRIKEGKIVDFYVYCDGDGLGAEECRPRSVLRLTLAHSEANTMLKYSSQWSEYLSDSEYYPSFEREHGVLLRKYAWQMPFALLELWGHPEELAAAALHLTAKGEDECDLRLIVPEADMSKVNSLPGSPKVSGYAVISDPVRCRSLKIQCSREEGSKAVKAFLKVTSAPPAAAGA